MSKKSIFPSEQRRIWIIVPIVLVVLIAGFLVWDNLDKLTSKPTTDPSVFSPYIESYSSGTISKQGSIRIRLANDQSFVVNMEQKIDPSIFEFSPKVKGEVFWVDSKTIEFKPNKSFESGKTYQIRFNLGKLMEVPKALEIFRFEIRVLEPSFQIETSGLTAQSSRSLDLMKFSGELQLADHEESSSIEKILEARLDGKTYPIKWSHDEGKKTSNFQIDSLPRLAQKAQKLELKWNGHPISSSKKGTQEWEVPQKGDFKFLNIKSIQDPEQVVLVQFSDPLVISQDLTGLFEIQGIQTLRYDVDGSEVKIYPSERLEGTYVFSINPGVENIESKKTDQIYQGQVVFENRLPAVSIPGNGSILPGSGQLTFPFEAVNLKAVDVTIVKIFAKNVPQYFQVDYDNSYELRRVAQPILQKTIRLDEDASLNLHKRNRFSLDVDQLVKTEPGAIYRVMIGFRKEYSVFPCSDESMGEAASENDSYSYYRNPVDVDGHEDFWSRYDGFYPMDYDWYERDNPCHSSYYTQDRWVKRDLLASNIGLLAKRGNDQSMYVVATHILTADPIADVDIKVLDYQQQIIQTGRTDAQGIVKFEDTKQPFLLIGEKDKEIGYLKLDEGNSLPLSRFDVSGDQIQKGLKGFIYTERGVWRPGDSLFVGFILEDKNNILPAEHPVTFELRDARGSLFQKNTLTKSLNGFYMLRTATSRSSATGNWQVKVHVGGSVFQKSLKVETVMPNRLKIDLDLGNQKLLKSTSPNIPLRVHWLFGAKASDLQARVDIRLSPIKTQFEKYSGYQFDDPTKFYEQESWSYFEGKLDVNGEASLMNRINQKVDAPGMLQAQFTTRVIEPGGGFSVDYQQIPFSPYTQYVGLKLPEGDRMTQMLLTDQAHELSIVMVDEQGNNVRASRKVQVELFKIRWSWWWNQDNLLSNFSQDQYNQLLKKEQITLNNGKGNWKFQVNYPDWGRYLVRVKDLEGGHSAAQTLYIDWPNWTKREQASNPTEASMLSFTADKDLYQVGEKVHLTIPSSEGGRALISIENGSKVLKQYWISTEAGQTTHSIEVTKDMAPNVYANITLLQPYLQTLNDLPLRMYGVIPLKVEDPQTLLQPKIKMNKTVRPESDLTVEISESKGKAMTYTIALVDEGLLDLTRFQTPDPHRSFYAREALGVKTWDLFDKVIGGWGGELERILGIGGDADLNRNLNPAKANRFQSVVQVLGPFYLKKGAKSQHKLKIPNYIGSLKAMVVAGQQGAYGSAEEQVSVKKPLMLLATLPRVAGPRESFMVPVTVFAMDPSIKKVRVQVEASEGLKVVEGVQELNFSKEGEQVAFFQVDASAKTGIGKLKILAQSGSEKATYDVEIDLRNPNPYEIQVDAYQVEASKSWKSSLGSLGGSDQESVLLEASTLPPINLHKRLQYLIRYPHGCLEQITSGVFPQLYLEHLVKLKDFEKSQILKNVQHTIDRLKAYQVHAGGFAYWPGQAEVEPWSTNYVGHFLLEAKKQGYVLPSGMEENWLRYQIDQARKWSPKQHNWAGADLVQAYRLFTLALAKKIEMGAMNRLKELPNLSDEAAWRLAAAYQLAGQNIVAQKIIKRKKLVPSSNYKALSTFGSQVRDQAMMLETLSLMDQRDQAQSLLQGVAQALGSNEWMSTQTTAYSLLGIAQYLRDTRGQKESLSFDYQIGNKSKVSINEPYYLFQMTLNPTDLPTNFSLQNRSKTPLFVRVIREGQKQVPERQTIDLNPRHITDYITLQVEYFKTNGEKLDPRKLMQGTDFYAEVTLINTGTLGTFNNLALTQIFPSGWEILQVEGPKLTYFDKRDDRVLAYLDLPQNQHTKMKIQLNATYSGQYYLPGAYVEAMYDDRIQAGLNGSWVEVLKK